MRKDYKENVGNLTIAIGLKYANIIDLSRLFTVRANILDEQDKETPISIFPCDKKFWDKLP